MGASLLALAKSIYYFIFTGQSPLNILKCHIAGNFFLTARALIGYFKVTWHLTMKLFPAKIYERATLENLCMTSEVSRWKALDEDE